MCATAALRRNHAQGCAFLHEPDENSGLGLDSIEDNLTANIAASYQRELQAQNSVDFDDLLILADKLLKEHRDVREAWQQRFRYITVDEFQDTNSLQMSLLGHLVGPEHNVCVVGDDDQSIYGWRGAQISNILEFERFFQIPPSSNWKKITAAPPPSWTRPMP